MKTILTSVSVYIRLFIYIYLIVKGRYSFIIYVGCFWPPGLCTIYVRQIPCCLIRYIYSVFHYVGNVRVWFHIDCRWSIARTARDKFAVEGGGRSHECGKNIYVGIHKNYTDVQFIASIQGPIPGTIPVPVRPG